MFSEFNLQGLKCTCYSTSSTIYFIGWTSQCLRLSAFNFLLIYKKNRRIHLIQVPHTRVVLRHRMVSSHNKSQCIKGWLKSHATVIVQWPTTVVVCIKAVLMSGFTVFNLWGQVALIGKALDCELRGTFSKADDQGLLIFLHSFVSRLALGPTRHPLKWVSGLLCGKHGRL